MQFFMTTRHALSGPMLRQHAVTKKSLTAVERDLLVQWVRKKHTLPKDLLDSCNSTIDFLDGTSPQLFPLID